MDGFIVTLALPAMAKEFGVGIQSVKWVVVAYLGALTVSLLWQAGWLICGSGGA